MSRLRGVLVTMAVGVATGGAIFVGALPAHHPSSPQASGGVQPHRAGAAALAAAYHYPLACLSVTFAASDPAYARARLDRASPCWRYGAYITAIFHRIDGVWRQVLDATVYGCPVVWLPAVVQTQLGVCAQTHSARRRHRR